MQKTGTLKRELTTSLLFLFILGDVLGAGIYALIGQISGRVGGLAWLPLLIALGLALLTAASYAELVTKYPQAGGAAVFAERAFKSRGLSFMVGFAMLAAGVVSAAGLAIAFAGDYLSAFIQIPPILGAVLFLLLIGALNLWGMKESMRANVFMTVVELSGLLLVVIVVAVFVSKGGGSASRPFEFSGETGLLPAVFSAALLAYYSFVGFETSANVIEEVKDPARSFPRALFGALFTAGALYVLVGIAVTAAVPANELSESTGPLLTVVQTAAPAIPSGVFAAIALLAVANGALLTMIMASRLAYGMARQGLLPGQLGRVLPGRGTPWVAIIATTGIAILLALSGTLETLAETVVLLLLFVFLSTNIAVLVLRRDHVERPHFRTWTILPALGSISCVVLMTQQSVDVWLRTAIILAIGAALYAATRFVRQRSLSRSR